MIKHPNLAMGSLALGLIVTHSAMKEVDRVNTIKPLTAQEKATRYAPGVALLGATAYMMKDDFSLEGTMELLREGWAVGLAAGLGLLFLGSHPVSISPSR